MANIVRISDKIWINLDHVEYINYNAISNTFVVHFKGSSKISLLDFDPEFLKRLNEEPAVRTVEISCDIPENERNYYV